MITIDNQVLMARGNARLNRVESLLNVLSNGGFSCKTCGHESHDRTNVVAHIGFVHGTPPCESCQDHCFGNCIVEKHKKFRESQYSESSRGSPTSTQPPFPVINSWAKFLGDYSPENALNPALDYNVIWKNGKVTGQWFCILCLAADEDIHTITGHINDEQKNN